MLDVSLKPVLDTRNKNDFINFGGLGPCFNPMLDSMIDAQKCQKFIIFLLPLNPFNELKYQRILVAGQKEEKSQMMK